MRVHTLLVCLCHSLNPVSHISHGLAYIHFCEKVQVANVEIFLCYSIWRVSANVMLCVAVLEEQKSAISKEATDLRNSLRDVEKARLEARRELQDLRRQVCVCFTHWL